LVSELSLYLWFSLWRASFLLSQLSGSDPRSEEGAVVGMVGTGGLGEVMGRVTTKKKEVNDIPR